MYSNFLTTLVDTFEQLDFQHDIRSTTNVQQALRKLPTETRLAWNRHAVSSRLKQPTLNDVTLWLREFALACSEMPVPQQTTSIKNGQPQFSHDSRSSSGTANHHKSSTNTPRSGPTTDALKKISALNPKDALGFDNARTSNLSIFRADTITSKS